ncbi:uncharacterized protein LOC113515784 [Galleria mellonella]|uniref:Uncharacterized protein LOC113515784 n=1 Tax=Galleria mellonella TaxID=7137 RepID=A0A6J1WU54_GALME|nr:uncharacterized protein LOC113515784 [Galleria mellonella]
MATESLRKLIEDIAKENKYGNPDIIVKPMSTDGANYSSALFTITVSESGKEDLHLFAKVIIINETIRSQMPAGVFDVERIIYVNLLRKYKDIEIAHDVPLTKRLNIPKYYGCNPKIFEETIVLENLGVKGYTTYDRFKSIDWDYAAKSVESLAKFHALSIAYRENYPEEFKQFVNNIKFQKDMYAGVLQQLYEQRIKTTLSVTNEKHKDKLQKYLETQLNLETILKFSETPERPVLCHGDYRPSNLMHRYTEDGTLEVIPVDFQTIQCSASPLTDLLYFIFTGSDEKFRREHFQDLIDHYYQELSSALQYLKLEPDVIYSKKTFEHDLKEFLPFGLFIAIFSLPIVTVEVDDAPSMQGDGGFEIFTSAKTGSLYPERMNGVINDYFRWGIIE